MRWLYRIVLQCIGSLRIVFHADDHRKCRVYSMGTISVNNLLNIGSLPLLCCEGFFLYAATLLFLLLAVGYCFSGVDVLVV